ncbi:PAS domain-containing protein [Caenispirillum bisanense]|uniref:PAS domain-containing protein n=1 Tax=Caenispirillum bisanense TaxID=414052 RepID=A0A286GK55_9PROT|nr:PAS domain-containing protein [Caenispirillum bisanense]SOD95479.1 PAS domain-containing protein [Caenispirillum bisanense]
MTIANFSLAANSGPLIDVLAGDGTIVTADSHQAAFLGYSPDDLVGARWDLVYSLDAREQLAALFAAPPARRASVVPLGLRTSSGDIVPTTAIFDWTEVAGEVCLRLFKWPAGSALDDVAALAEANEILAGIVAASADAGWCMEWADPVDLSAPQHEVVRQVFENGPRWRFCNDAMARLYRTPADVDFNARPVSEIFPRTPENEAFVRSLIEANFDVNGKPSRDLRYDGVFIDVENDVRGHIVGNRLYRMWGTVRDVSKHIRRETMLKGEIESLQSVLMALPDPVVVVTPEGDLVYANIAAEALFDGQAEVLALRGFAALVEFDRSLDAVVADVQASPAATSRSPFSAQVVRPDGRMWVEVTASYFELRGSPSLVLCLRPARHGDERRGQRLQAGGRR